MVTVDETVQSSSFLDSYPRMPSYLETQVPELYIGPHFRAELTFETLKSSNFFSSTQIADVLANWDGLPAFLFLLFILKRRTGATKEMRMATSIPPFLCRVMCYRFAGGNR